MKSAAAMAKNRGDVAQKWYAEGNVLTPETLPIFKKLMRKADIEFKQGLIT